MGLTCKSLIALHFPYHAYHIIRLIYLYSNIRLAVTWQVAYWSVSVYSLEIKDFWLGLEVQSKIMETLAEFCIIKLSFSFPLSALLSLSLSLSLSCCIWYGSCTNINPKSQRYKGLENMRMKGGEKKQTIREHTQPIASGWKDCPFPFLSFFSIVFPLLFLSLFNSLSQNFPCSLHPLLSLEGLFRLFSLSPNSLSSCYP